MAAVRTGFAILLLAGAAGAQEKTLLHEGPQGIYRVPLPVRWQGTATRNDAEFAVLSYDAVVMAGQPVVEITVWLLPGAQRSPRGQAYYARASLAESMKADSAVVGLDPLPHLTLLRRREDGAERFFLIGYKLFERNMLAVSFAGSQAVLATVRPHLFAAVEGLEADLPSWPAYPAEYERFGRDGLEYLVHPGFPAARLESMQHRLLAVRRAYEERMGQVPPRPRNRLQVVLHASASRARALCPEAGEAPFYSDFSAGRLFATPIHGDDARAEALLAHAFSDLLHYQRFGGAGISWIRMGEAHLDWVTTLTGRKLPAVTRGFADSLSEVIVPIEEMRVLKTPGKSAQARAYALFFHCGPKQYREAFSSFLASGDADGDWEKAHALHLESLDSAKLRAEVRHLRNARLEIVKPR